MPEEIQLDWSEVVARNPKGYMEVQTGGRVIHGPVEKVELIEAEELLIITLKWAASMPTMDQPGFGKWVAAPFQRVHRFSTFHMPFVIESTPEKGDRVRFGLNIIYFDPVDGVDPSKVEGLVLQTTGAPAENSVVGLNNLRFFFEIGTEATDVIVGVHTDNSYHGLRLANALEQALRGEIPFEYEIISEPEVRTLGGYRRKGIMSVRMHVRPINDGTGWDVIKAFESAKFQRGLDFILG